MTKQRIGIYGGTFDPIHIGHVALAVALKEAHNFDAVWMVPAGISPFKIESHPVSFDHRCNMVERAIQGSPLLDGFECKRVEGERDGPSYTVDTVERLIEGHPDVQFTLMLGDDSAVSLHRWHRVDELIQMVDVVVGRRSAGVEYAALKQHGAVWGRVQAGLTPTPLMEVSATDIRSRLANQQYCGHLVLAPVLDYIATHQLYSG